MSQSKMDRSFPVGISEEELAKVVAAALRRDFGEGASSVKRIGQLTHANLRAIRNWYEAKNAPSSTHLLLLARSSHSILKFILEQVGGDNLLDEIWLPSYQDGAAGNLSATQPKGGIYRDKNVPINGPEQLTDPEEIIAQGAVSRKCWRSATFGIKNLVNHIDAPDDLRHMDIKIASAKDFGKAVRTMRKVSGTTQDDLALATETNRGFIIDLERGKPTCQLGKALVALQCLGASLHMIDGDDPHLPP